MAKSGISAAELLLNKLGSKCCSSGFEEREIELGDIELYRENRGLELYLGKNPDETVENFGFCCFKSGNTV